MAIDATVESLLHQLPGEIAAEIRLVGGSGELALWYERDESVSLIGGDCYLYRIVRADPRRRGIGTPPTVAAGIEFESLADAAMVAVKLGIRLLSCHTWWGS